MIIPIIVISVGTINSGDGGIYLLSIYVNNNPVNNNIEDPNIIIKLPIIKGSKNLVIESFPPQIE